MGKKENRLLEKSTKSCIVDNRKFLEDIRMNKIKRYLSGLAFLALAVIFSGGGIQAKAMKLSAESAVVMDVQSGAILYQKNMDKQEYPASITKVMTAMLAIENSSLMEWLPILPRRCSWRAELLISS